MSRARRTFRSTAWLVLAMTWPALLPGARGQGAAPVVLAVAGQTLGYLEPCGCGGQHAGGLARRAALLTELRRQFPALVVCDLGGFGPEADQTQVVAQALAMMGAVGTGLSTDDLTRYETIRAAADATGLRLTSLSPPAAPVMPAGWAPSWLCGPEEAQIGLLSVAYSSASLSDLAVALQAQLGLLAASRPRAVVMISHLAERDTQRLLDTIPSVARPQVVLLATSQDLPDAVTVRDGVTWVPVAQKGRSLSVVEIGSGPQVMVTVKQQLVVDGPRDEAVQRLVDGYYNRLKERERRPARREAVRWLAPESCRGCHAAAYGGWSRQAHARAVDTLEQKGRDLAACLRCHDERLRQEGLRAARGTDRGVVCASCHGALSDHLRDSKMRPSKVSRATCEACHTLENSPRWSYEPYLRTVAAACRGEATGG